MVGGLNRTYLVHAPAGLDRPNGLVLNLHGAGMTGGAQAAATNFNAVADQHGFVVAYPNGFGGSWNSGACCSPFCGLCCRIIATSSSVAVRP